jgi:hypothetical protein
MGTERKGDKEESLSWREENRGYRKQILAMLKREVASHSRNGLTALSEPPKTKRRGEARGSSASTPRSKDGEVIDLQQARAQTAGAATRAHKSQDATIRSLARSSRSRNMPNPLPYAPTTSTAQDVGSGATLEEHAREKPPTGRASTAVSATRRDNLDKMAQVSPLTSLSASRKMRFRTNKSLRCVPWKFESAESYRVDDALRPFLMSPERGLPDWVATGAEPPSSRPSTSRMSQRTGTPRWAPSRSAPATARGAGEGGLRGGALAVARAGPLGAAWPQAPSKSLSTLSWQPLSSPGSAAAASAAVAAAVSRSRARPSAPEEEEEEEKEQEAPPPAGSDDEPAQAAAAHPGYSDAQVETISADREGPGGGGDGGGGERVGDRGDGEGVDGRGGVGGRVKDGVALWAGDSAQFGPEFVLFALKSGGVAGTGVTTTASMGDCGR